MSVAKEMRKCPYCREPIALDALRCKHCHVDLSEGKKRPAFVKKIDTFRTGFLAGILFTVVIYMLIYYQFFAGD